MRSHALPNDFAQIPLAVFANHAAWWDPLIFLILAEHFFASRTAFGPIDASALRRYGFLERLGFFGVDGGFLRTADAVLATPERMLWITPQGKFADARQRPVAIERGLAHLATRSAAAVFLPLAIEYTFWEERLPEVLIAFGTPLFTQHHRDSCGVADWTAAFSAQLGDAQDALAAAAQRRDASEWQVLLRGGAGTNVLYDTWRRFRAALRGENFSSAHSDL